METSFTQFFDEASLIFLETGYYYFISISSKFQRLAGLGGRASMLMTKLLAVKQWALIAVPRTLTYPYFMFFCVQGPGSTRDALHRSSHAAILWHASKSCQAPAGSKNVQNDCYNTCNTTIVAFDHSLPRLNFFTGTGLVVL